MTSSTASFPSPYGGGSAPQPSAKPRLIVVDDEASMRNLFKVILEGEGYDVFVTDDGTEALVRIASHGCDLLIHDLRMPKMDGLTLLRKVKEAHPGVICIVVTAFGTWETAVEAMRLGAYTHIGKPFDTAEMRQLVARALERKELAKASKSNADLPFLDIVGNSALMNAVVHMIQRIAPTDSTVLIAGESGTGKELIARAIHYNSLRAKGPFLPVNCGAFTETLLESELFGHVKGAFTNAVADRKGLFASADLGTLFLDEIGEMSPVMQVKLLRVLETHTFKPVGGNREIRTDVRIIAATTATNRNLAQMVADGNFREDLFHRLNVIPITLPPLRDRPEDIPMLAGHFLARFTKRMNKSVRSIDKDAMERLIAFDWPGNVRELENTIERAVALCTLDRITGEDIVGPMATPSASGRVSSAQLAAVGTGPPRPTSPRISTLGAPVPPTMPAAPAVPGGAAMPPLPENGFDLERHLMEQERAYILQALDRTDWNLTEAAKLLGMTFRSIRYRVSKLGIQRPDK
ncbi:MAG: sigma-54 dependent transcriptional regulator [Planctomycetes bacterium]|nr:sigma-54 dependent transcriptional regulator [Planctomycetota bacterium]